jgi:hypothetical protein
MAYNNIPIIVVLWEHVGYGGRRLVLTEDTLDLGVYGFHDMASSIGIHPGPNYVAGTKHEVSFYEHSLYGGAQLILTGPAAYPNLVRPYNFNDVISSVNFNQGAPGTGTITPIPVVAELYEHVNFTGRKFIVVQNVANLHTYGAFGDIVSSVKVMQGPNFAAGKKAKLCRDVGGSGGCIELAPGDYPNLHASHGFGDVCSSVYVNY